MGNARSRVARRRGDATAPGGSAAPSSPLPSPPAAAPAAAATQAPPASPAAASPPPPQPAAQPRQRPTRGSPPPPSPPSPGSDWAGEEGDEEEEDEDDDLEAQACQPRPRGVFKSARAGFEALVCAIIRPPRALYSPEADLGPKEFRLRGRRFTRTDVRIPSSKRPGGLAMVGSLWAPVAADRPASALPCVVYLHGNSSCRAAALEILPTVLAEGACLFAFDFCGSGLSGGEWVTLGWYEAGDLQDVLAFLRQQSSWGLAAFALWGRSMGAATALLHLGGDPSIAGAVLDSPFASLKGLALELAARGREALGVRVPGFAVGAGLALVRRAVKRRSGLDLYKLEPLAAAPRAFSPAFFMAGGSDTLIPPSHTQALVAAYGGDHSFLLMPAADHNGPRPGYALDSGAIFLRQVLLIDERWTLPSLLLGVSSSGSGGGGGSSARASPRSSSSSSSNVAPVVPLPALPSASTSGGAVSSPRGVLAATAGSSSAAANGGGSSPSRGSSSSSSGGGVVLGTGLGKRVGAMPAPPGLRAASSSSSSSSSEGGGTAADLAEGGGGKALALADAAAPPSPVATTPPPLPPQPPGARAPAAVP